MKLSNLFKISLISSAILISGNLFAKNGHIKVGVMSGPEAAFAQTAAEVAKKKYNLDVELIEFTDYVLPNTALVTKQLDANAFQTLPYLERQAKDRGWDNLITVGKTFIYPIAGYSKKIKNLNELKEGATIAIANDPTNLGRALLLLQSQGLIKLKNPKSLTQTELDIVENPKNIQIKTADANLLVRALAAVDAAVINTNYSSLSGLLPNKNSIFVEGKDSPYVNYIVSRTDNQQDPDVQNFVKSYQSKEVYDKANTLLKGAVIKGW